MSEEIMRTLKEHGKQLELIATTVLNNQTRLDNVEEKLEKLPTTEKLDDAINKADEVLKKAIDREQEDIMRTYAIKRVEQTAEQNAKDIKVIKPLVGMA